MQFCRQTAERNIQRKNQGDGHIVVKETPHIMDYRKGLRISKLLMVVVSVLAFVGCKDGIVNDSNNNDNVICYEKPYSNHWEIFTNNISGTNPQNISNYSGDDEYPQWSPDGKYIVYSRRLPSHIVVVVVYNTGTHINTLLTNDSVDAGLTPQWTPNGKIFYFARSSYNVYDSGGTYLINPDGSQKKKILDFGAQLYFYNDSYNFLYIKGTNVDKSNIDNTLNELVLELPPPESEQFITIRDFNPLTADILINTNTVPGSSDAIAIYNAETKRFSIMLNSEDGYVLYLQKYSSDFSKIAFIEHSSDDEYLSLLENGKKKRLLRIPRSNPPINFSFEPMEFSPDGKYIAFSEQITNSSQWISFSTPLYAIKTAGGAPYKLEEEAHGPSWNPHQ